MKHILSLLLTPLFILQSCKQHTSNSDTVSLDTVETDTIVNKPDDYILQPSGYFTGIIPCADCEGIRQMILLTPDHKYHLEENYIGKNEAPFISEGRWEAEGSKLRIYTNNKLLRQYAINEQSITQLDMQGNVITGELAEKYTLNKKEIGHDNKAWMQKKTKGVNIIGVGTEPFWAIDIGKDSIKLQVSNNDLEILFPLASTKPNGNNYTISSEKDGKKIDISVRNEFCSDGMSDTWYEYSIQVNYDGVLYKGCAVKLNDFE